MNRPMLKRLAAFVLAFMLVMTNVMPALATEGEGEACSHNFENGACTLCQAPHECSFETETAKTEATCDNAGSVTKACSCGATDTQAIGALGHSYVEGICSVCSTKKPCTMALDCDAPEHVEECLSQCTGEPECANKAHKETCLSQCTGNLNCENGAHKEDCLSQASCTCVRLCSETMVCPVCEAGGECKGGEAAERIAAVQILIDALPTSYNFSESDAVKVQYDACTEAIAALSDAERDELNLANYHAAAQPTVIDDSAASVGETKYATLEEAFKKAANNSTIIVNKNLTLTNPIEIPAGKTFTLDLNGKVISQTKAQTEAYAMIYNHGTLTIQDSGNDGKISYTDSGNGGEYISDTIYNYGTLTMKSGTVENLSSTTVATNGYPQALDNYDGATLYVQGGNVSSPNYTAIRMFCGTAGITATISGGNITGNVDLQNVNGNANKGTLNITGGSMNHVRLVNFGTNLTNMKANISGGNIAVIRCSGSTTGDTYLKQVFTITGGSFKNGDTVTDVSTYVKLGYIQNSETGAVIEKSFDIAPSEDKVQVSETVTVAIPEAITNNNAITSSNVISSIDSDSITSTIAGITDANGATDVEISMKIVIMDYDTNTDGTTELKFDVAPHIQPVDDEGKAVGDGDTISEVESAITFRLPMPAGTKGKFATVYHTHGTENEKLLGSYEIKEESGSCYIEISSSRFSEFRSVVDPSKTVSSYVAEDSKGGKYETLQDAIDYAASGETITLLKNIEGLDTVIEIDKSITINGAQGGTTVSSSASRVFRITTDANNATITLNNIKVVSTAVREGTNDIRGISIDPDTQNIKLNLNSCSVDFTDASANDWSYGVNVATSSNHTIKINGGSYEGANAINLWGSKHNVTIEDAALTSLYGPNDQYVGACVRLEGTNTVTIEGTTFAGSHAVPVSENSGTTSTITQNNNTDNSKFYVAKIGTAYYYTLKQAAAAAQSGNEIVLINPVELNEAVEIPANATLNLNDKTLALAAGGSLKAAAGLNVTTEEEDYKVEYKNGTYQLIAREYIAQVGNDKFESLSDAFAAASGKTVQLLKDVKLTTALSVAGNITLEGGNYTLSMDGDNDMITVTTGGSLTIKSGTYGGKLNASGGTITIQGGTFNKALAGSVTIPGTIPGATSGTTVANPAKFKLEPASAMIADNYKAVKSGDWYVIQENAHLMVSTGDIFTKRYYGTGETFESVLKSEVYSSIKLTQDEAVTSAVSLTKDTTIVYDGHKITGSGSIRQTGSGKSLYLKGIGGIVDLKLGPGDKAAFNTNGDVGITAAEDYNGSTAVGYGEVGVSITSEDGTKSYTYSIGKDTILIVKANGAIDSISTEIEDSKGQVNILRATNSTKPLYYMSYIGDGVSSTQYQYFVTGTSKVLVFESNGFFDGLSHVEVDDKVLTKDTHYTAKRGSTIVTLKNAYLKTLSLGKHTLTMYFDDGQTCEGNFYVVSSAKDAWNPKTGDTIMAAVGIMAAAAAGLAVLIYLGKKKKK